MTLITTTVELLQTLKEEGWPVWAIIGTVVWYVLFKIVSKLGILAKTFAESMRDHYGKIMDDLERTNERLMRERDDAEKRLAAREVELEDARKIIKKLTSTP